MVSGRWSEVVGIASNLILMIAKILRHAAKYYRICTRRLCADESLTTGH